MMISIREPNLSDESAFINAAVQSEAHFPWTTAPKTKKEFNEYIDRFKLPTQKSYLVMGNENALIGVFNLSEIVRGCFQNAYLGYYVFNSYEGKGYMSINGKWRDHERWAITAEEWK